MKKIIKILFCFFAFYNHLSASPTSVPCKEILKSPLERNKILLKKEIFEAGEGLLKEFFGHSRWRDLKKEQKQSFLSQNKEKIIQNVIQQGTVLEAVADSSSFVVRGGTSRLARMATGLKKLGITTVLDMEALLQMRASGYYSPKKHTILLGLEDALYPNQLSYNFLHEAMHTSLDHKSLFIPRIHDRLESNTYKDFSLDEVYVYSKQIMQMVNESVKVQNRTSLEESHQTELVEVVEVFKELSLRTLRKKNELLKIVDYLKKVERDPSVLKEQDFTFSLEGLDPEIVLYKSAFYRGKDESVDSIMDRAWASRMIIEDVLYFAEMAFR